MTKLIALTITIAALAFTSAASAKPSAFVAGLQFCQAFNTKTLAMRFDTKPSKVAVSAQVGRWLTGQIKNDPPGSRYPARYQAIIANGCAAALR